MWVGFRPGGGGDDGNKMPDRGINAAIVLGASTYALTKPSPWTIFEILRYMPEHNWSVYEEALKANPVLAKMMISGVVHSSATGYRCSCSRIVAVPVKVAFDQTAWSALWNSIYFVALGFLRWESPFTIFSELKATFFPMLTAGWKLWLFAHLITYGVVPIEQRFSGSIKSEARILDDSLHNRY
ncbi:hypothetical protein ZWY2020_039111, partial [Hordeum vulgare]